MVLPQDLFQYNPHEVLNLPLTGHTTDLSFGTAKAAPQTAHVVTLVGSPTVDADGLHLNGSNQSAYLADSADWTFGSGAFGVRVRVKPDDLPSAGQYRCILSQYNSTSGQRGWTMYHWNSAGTHKVYFYAVGDLSGSPEVKCEAAFTLPTDSFTTIRAYRTADSWNLEINGNVVATQSIGMTIPDASTPLYIGNDVSGLYYFKGAIKDLIILKGTSVAPASTYQYALQDFRVARNGTEVAVSYPLRGRDPISGIVDGWYKGNFDGFYSRHGFATAVGDANVANGYLALDGDDYATIPASADWNFGSGDFTLECWIRMPSFTQRGILQMGATTQAIWSTPGRSFYLMALTGADAGKLFIDAYWSDKRTEMASSSFLTANTWHHIAVVRQGEKCILYGDGQKVAEDTGITGTMNATYDVTTLGVVFLNQPSSPAWREFWQGGIQDLRICKGTALYTETFTPPARGSLTPDTDTVLLLPFTENLLDYAVADGETRGDDAELECYIGNADAEPPTEEVEWPAAYKALWFRSGFLSDMIGGFDLENTSAALTPNGLYLGGANYATLPFGTAMSDMFKKVGTDDFCWLILWTTAELSRRGGLISTHFSSGVRPDAIDVEQQANNTPMWFFRSVTNPDTNHAQVVGVSLSLDTPAITGVCREGTTYYPISNGVKGSPVTAFQTDIHDENFPIAFGKYDTHYAKGLIGVIMFFRGTVPTDDQCTILDRLLRQWATYNEPATVLQSRYEYESVSRSASP